MQGKLLAAARRDAQKFATAGGFQEDIKLSTPDGTTELELTGLATSRWQSFMDGEGKIDNSQSFHVGIHEQVLADAAYPVRNPLTNKVKLEKHRVSFKDNNGNEVKFVINEAYPNGTTGLIMCILGLAKSWP